MSEAKQSSSGKPLRRWPLLAGVALVVLGLWGARKFQEARLYAKNAAESQKANEIPQVKTYRVRPQNIVGMLKRIGVRLFAIGREQRVSRKRVTSTLNAGLPGKITRLLFLCRYQFRF